MLRAWLLPVLLSSLLSGNAALAEADPEVSHGSLPVISIIIDDLGYHLADGRRVVGLPGPVACSVLPHTPYGSRLADSANWAGKEVLLHLPMQPMNDKDPGFGALTLDTSEQDVRRLLAANLAAVPHVVGINNHMGSLLTRHPGHMRWLMQSLRESSDGLFFVDSVTSPRSIAMQLAQENDVPATRRDVFLDRDPDPDAVAAQFAALIALAHTRGSAIAIGHPYPSTIAVLERELARLEVHGVRLIGVAEFIRLSRTENSLWHASLSPSQTVSKN